MTGEDRILDIVGRKRSDFDMMCRLYREWNDKINVISRKDIDFVFEHHVLHSLCIAAYLSSNEPQVFSQWVGSGGVAEGGTGGVPDSAASGVRVLDLGCGGGFPGIPLAFCFPGVEFTLCDSIGKKITVASAVAGALGLKNVRFVNGRVEEQKDRWNWVVSRAVAPLDKLLDWTAGKFTDGIICLKGGDLTAEMQECLRPEMTRRLARYGMGSPSIESWSISDLLPQEYYQGKVVIGLNW